MDIFLEFPLSLGLDQILGNLNHFQNRYQLHHQTERQLVASHFHVFDSEIFSVLLWCASVFHKFESIHTRTCHSAHVACTCSHPLQIIQYIHHQHFSEE